MQDQQDYIQVQVSIDEIIKDFRKEWSKQFQIAKDAIPRIYLSYDDFQKLFIAAGSILLAKKRNEGLFIIDEQNSDVIRQLFYYATNDPKFKGDLDKGIALVGAYGCGKTIIMEAFKNVVNTINAAVQKKCDSCCDLKESRKYVYSRARYRFITASELSRDINNDTFSNYINGALIIDEVGREAKSVKHYGNEILPIFDVLFDRYKNGSITHITANYSLEALSKEDMYGQMLGDRLKEMFNFIVLPGKSRRK